MLKIKEAYAKLKDSAVFKNRESKDYLCGAFLLCAPNELDSAEWQIDFYDPDKDSISSFVVGKEIKVEKQGDKVFKGKNDKVEELNLDEVKIEFSDALDTANSIVKKHKETPTKIIVILQKASIPTWNLSYITTALNLLNVKINAVDGTVIEEKILPVMSFKE